jgi:hypothetical protein
VTRKAGAGAFTAVALLLTACAHKKPVVRFDDSGGAEEPWVMARKSYPPPGKGKDPPPDQGRTAVEKNGRLAVASRPRTRLAPPPRGPREEPLEAAKDDPARPEPSAAASPGPAGPAPDEAQVQGEPDARRPEELSPAPVDRPQRYASPAPLKRVLDMQRSNDARMPDTEAGGDDIVLDASATPAAFPPASTAALNDELPDSVVSDPSELGSYHVQVSSSPVFASTLFNKVYPFMADIDLESDLAAIELKRGGYWIRWAVVDLLGFEHPFVRPKRLIFLPR